MQPLPDRIEYSDDTGSYNDDKRNILGGVFTLRAQMDDNVRSAYGPKVNRAPADNMDFTPWVMNSGCSK